MVALFDSAPGLPGVNDNKNQHDEICKVLERRVANRIKVAEGGLAEIVLADFREQLMNLRGIKRTRKCLQWLDMYSAFVKFEEEYGASIDEMYSERAFRLEDETDD